MDDTIESANRPAVFLTDRDGVIRIGYRSKDFNDRMTSDGLLKEQAEIYARSESVRRPGVAASTRGSEPRPEFVRPDGLAYGGRRHRPPRPAS